MKNRFDNVLNMTPKFEFVPEFNATGKFEGIKAITFDGANIGNEKTKTFAYLGYPQNAVSKVPGIVLVHGGGGVPYLDWIKKWNNHGYAAVAISTEGDFPTKVNAGSTADSEQNTLWHRGLYGIFSEEGYTNAPSNDHLEKSEENLEKQWMYHAVSQVIAAHCILRDDNKVDEEKIGIMGVSWGGVITSIAIGYDTGFAFAISVYGSGYLSEGMGNISELYFRQGRNRDLWAAEDNFKNVTKPVLWQCKKDDIPFSLNSNSQSYLSIRKNNVYTCLSTVYDMHHSHEGALLQKEPYIFADSVCRKGKRIPAIYVDKNKVMIDNPDDAEILSWRVLYITEPMSYRKDETDNMKMQQEWFSKQLENIEAYVPDEACEYYFEAIVKVGETECITTSQLLKKTDNTAE